LNIEAISMNISMMPSLASVMTGGFDSYYHQITDIANTAGQTHLNS